MNQILWPTFTVLCALSLYESWRRKRRRAEVMSWALAFAGGLCSVVALYRPSPVVALAGKLALLAFALLGLVLRRVAGGQSGS